MTAVAETVMAREPNIVVRLARRPTALIGMIVLVLMILLSLLAPYISPYDPAKLMVRARLTAPGGDSVDHRLAAGRVTAVHDDLRAVPCQFLRRRLANAGGRTRHQRTTPLEVSLLVHVLSLSTNVLGLAPPNHADPPHGWVSDS